VNRSNSDALGEGDSFLFLADAALDVERTMLAASPRPSREGSAGLLVNRSNSDALGEGDSFQGVTRQASASISAFYLGNAPAPRCWMGLRNISRRRSFGPQRSKMSLALIQMKAGTVRRRSSENIFERVPHQRLSPADTSANARRRPNRAANSHISLLAMVWLLGRTISALLRQI